MEIQSKNTETPHPIEHQIKSLFFTATATNRRFISTPNSNAKSRFCICSLAKQAIRRILEINSAACLIRDSLSKRHLPMGRHHYPPLAQFLTCPSPYPSLPVTGYAENTTFYIYAAFFNILLTYGMETSFFAFLAIVTPKSAYSEQPPFRCWRPRQSFLRCYSLKQSQSLKLWECATIILFVLGVLLCDTLVVIPFAYLRATGKASRFTSLKLLNVGVYVGLNLLFLWWIPKGIKAF